MGAFDVSMIVMGGIIGVGIFANPSIVARHLHSTLAILSCWLVGGIIAFTGALIHSELASRLPVVGGQYAYLREGLHPSVAFVFGWTTFLVIQPGGMAAVSIIFANYFLSLTHLPLAGWQVATSVLAVLAIINCFGVRAGSGVQNMLMLVKIVTISGLVVVGLLAGHETGSAQAVLEAQSASSPIMAFGIALIPILFAFGGLQTTSFMAGEVRDPRKNLVRGFLLGMSSVVLLYLAVNIAYISALGVGGLAATDTPASDLMRNVIGETGATLAALGITISALGFLSQSVLTAPRVLFAMANDGLFFREVGKVHPRTHAPVVAIILQCLITIVIAALGRYEQILNYVMTVEAVFLGLNAVCIFALRRRAKRGAGDAADQLSDASGRKPYLVPGHPYTTSLFILASWFIVFVTIYKYPQNSLIGLGIALLGIPVYLIWSRQKPSAPT